MWKLNYKLKQIVNFIMLVFPLIFLIFLSPAFAEPIPDHDNPYAPIFTDKQVYTWTDKIHMTILAPSWNTDRHLIDSIGDEQNPIKVSTREHFLSPYKFTETGANSGIFAADITLTGFSHDVDGDGTSDVFPRTLGTGPNGGFLQTNRDSAVTISFEFAKGIVLSQSVPISWNVGHIQFANELYLSKDTVTVQVTDIDLNLNPESLDTVSILITSTSDISGILVDAIETLPSSGEFVANVAISQETTSNGNSIFVKPGDTIFAKYVDYTLPKPYSISDNLDISTMTTLDGKTHKLQSLPIVLSNAFGVPLNLFSVNNQMQINGNLSNPQNFKQGFVYLYQIKDQNNFIVSISWVQGEVSANKNLNVSQSWIPQHAGIYTIETYTWVSLANPVPLSDSVSKSIFVN